MDRFIIILLICFAASCSHTKRSMDESNDKNISSNDYESFYRNNHSLTLLIHSGTGFMEIHDTDTIVTSEAQIISCTPTTLKYGYGSVVVEDTLQNNIEWLHDYSEIENYSIRERKLDEEEKTFVSMAITELSNFACYESPIIVKDAWEYILYVDNIKVAYGYVGTLDTFPKNISDIIEQLIAMVAPLYPLNGFA